MDRVIPPAILSAIAEERAILFLGAGASYDALLAGQTARITADKVKAKLSDTFLGGLYKDRPLMSVADFARNEDSLLGVQTTIRKMFVDLEPNTFHFLISQFRWKAIVTTNYDLVIERAYERSEGLQKLAPVAKDGSELQNALSGQNTVPYLKLHGCINNYTDTKVPIILDSLEYSKFAKGRNHLVTTFKEWAINYPIIFCGYSIGDENIKQILFDIGDDSQVRPQYMFVNPGIEAIEDRYWSQRRIAPYSGTFEEFLRDADSNIPPSKRNLASFYSKSTLTIAKWIPSHIEPSSSLVQYLSDEVTHVLPEQSATLQLEPQNFYSGLDVSFTPIYRNLDVRRQIVDELLNKVVLDTIKSTKPKFFLLRGYAGCGKSVIARRLAIETASLIDAPLVVHLQEGALIRENLLLELQQLVQSRLYIFLDDLIEFGESLPPFLETLKSKNVPITVFACVRTNEFNIFGSKYAGKITQDFDVGDLGEPEIDALLERLAAYKLLGPLQNYDESERKIFVEKFYGRQLLVALHEITKGSSFEDIILDEFEKIIPRQAQQIYLDICTLHQCRVGARAGLISRLAGIEIASLKNYLSGPLANVVRISYDHRYRDFVYRSRHEEIAKMIFDLAIKSADQRADQLKRILSGMDLDYSSDNKAFFELLKGKKLADDFESKGLAISIFNAAEESNPPASYILHQRAILELNHKNGNLETANELLRRAEIEVRAEGYTDSSIQHTRANLLRRRANSVTLLVEKERYRADARAILRPQLGRRDNTYPENLYGQLLLDEIRDAVEQGFTGTISAAGGITGKGIGGDDPTVRLINELSILIDDVLKQSPSDAPMTLLKAEFLKTLGKNPNAINLLERYCEKNNASTSITRVLSEALIDTGRLDDAVKILRAAVIAFAGDKGINLALAKALIQEDEAKNSEAILSFLRRSFTDGDSNYIARLMFARCNMLYGDLQRGKDEFDSLQRLYLETHERPHAFVLNADKSTRRYIGSIKTRQHGFGFITSHEIRFDVYFPKTHAIVNIWESLNRGSNVLFSLGFSFRGPIAVDIELLT